MTDPSRITTEEMAARLSLYKYSEAACRAAIRGEKIPHELGQPLIRLCLVRGIRYCDGFGEELRGVLPEFTRALNARSIMSNRIPDMREDDEVPYCIWYPQVASKATYRELARRYPHMAYQVGRACAVAGVEYLDLYKELDIFPDVHIAEEAREAGNLDLYDFIMTQPLRYDVMNDYTRSVAANPRKGAHLNGDTAVCRSLDIKQEFRTARAPDHIDKEGKPRYIWRSRGFDINVFDITEDMNIEEMSKTGIKGPLLVTSPAVLELLSSPLPTDLPTVDKDLLILMAAYYGDIDRYIRLRRPKPLVQEVECCVRGIYHNTMFALWWARQEQSDTSRTISDHIRQAISARMIMNNVIARMEKKEFDDPYLIWYPCIAAESTYRELFRIRPSMSPQILRACIAGNYLDLFEETLAEIKPDVVVVEEANVAGGSFKHSMERRLHELAGCIAPIESFEHWKRGTRRELEVVGNGVSKTVGISTGFGLLYDGLQCNAEGVEVLASMPKEWREFPEQQVDLDYVEWPPGKEDGTTGA